MVNAFRDIAFNVKSPSIQLQNTATENLSYHSIIRRQTEATEMQENESISTIAELSIDANESVENIEPSIQKSSYLKPVSSQAFAELSKNVLLEDSIISEIIPELDFNFDATASQVFSDCTEEDIYKNYRKISQMGTNTFISKNVESDFFRKFENNDSQISSNNSVKSENDEFLFSQPVDNDFNFEIPLTVQRRTTDQSYLTQTQSDFKFVESQSEKNRSRNIFINFGAPKRKINIKSSPIDFFDFGSRKVNNSPQTKRRSQSSSFFNRNSIGENNEIPLTPNEDFLNNKSDYFRSSPMEIIDLTEVPDIPQDLPDLIGSDSQNKSRSRFADSSIELPSKIQISSSSSSHYNVSSSNIRSSFNELSAQSSSDNKILEKSKDFKNLFFEKNIRKSMSYKRSKVADNKIYNSARVERIKNINRNCTSSETNKILSKSAESKSSGSGILKNRVNHSMESMISKNSHSVTFAPEPKKMYVQPIFYKRFDVKQQMIVDSWNKEKPYRKQIIEETSDNNLQIKSGQLRNVPVAEDDSTKIGGADAMVSDKSPIILPPSVSSIFTSFIDVPLRKPIRSVINKNIKCRTHPGIFID